MSTGSIAGEPIRWHSGPSADYRARNMVVIVWVGGTFYMHCRPVPLCTLNTSDELWRARFRREVKQAAHELRCRVYRRARNV